MMKRIVLFAVLWLVVLCGQAQDKQSLRDSLAAATEALAYHPDSVDLRLKKAAWNVELEQWQYAKDDYDRVLRKEPDNVAALYYRAFVNEKLGRYNFARLDYQNLIRLVPGNFEIQLGYALLNQKDHHYTEAMDQMNLLVSQYPDSALAYAARAGMEVERGQYELASYDYEEAILRDGTNTDYILAHADVLITLGRKEKARQQLDRLVALGVPRGSLKDYYKRLK
ncbi:MAG: tetratricopeptide repeat protein [Prevotella sp.]|nr:tetratricopeptide repeat protein [Prevotella sp.]